MKQLATAAASRDSGDHWSPGPSNSGGGALASCGKPAAVMATLPPALPTAATE
jgi:hypothetical protein